MSKARKPQQHNLASQPRRIVLGGSVTLSLKQGLAGIILNASVRYLLDCRRVERQPTSSEGGSPDGHDSAALASTILAATFLEAGVNDIFLSAVHRDRNVFPGVSQETFALAEELWEELEKVRATPTRKAQVLLLALGRPQFDKGLEPFQSTADLIELRNALVHYKPEWDTSPVSHHKLGERLRGRFRENPYCDKVRAFFPRRCLGAGCAEWACRTACSFLSELNERLGSNSPVAKHVAKELAALESDPGALS